MKKGLSLPETIVSIAILSLLVAIMVQIILFYNKFQRETAFLTTATLDAKEIGIKIERYMILSRYIETERKNNNGYTYIIKCKGDSDNPHAPPESEIWYINKNNEKHNQVVIYDNLINTKIEKKLSKEIYMVLNEYKDINPQVFEVSFYVYNKYAQKYRNLNKKILAYYISIIKWKKIQ